MSFSRRSSTVARSLRRLARESHASAARRHPLAARIRKDTGAITRAVGLITTPRQAEAILARGDADLIALARAVLDDPRWGWRAADALGAVAHFAPQYHLVRSEGWRKVRDANAAIA